MTFIDTHAHLDGEEFREDLPAVIDRAREAGVGKIIVPAINLDNVPAVLALCRQYPGYCYPLVGLQPEEVDASWEEALRRMRDYLSPEVIGIGECGLDFYWSREHEQEQLKAFEEQVRWSVETRLPLMIHCRKAQQEMISILRKYEEDLPGGVFHCFTGNQQEAEAFLRFPRFVLGVAICAKTCLPPSPWTASSWRPTARTWRPCLIGANATRVPSWPRCSPRWLRPMV